MKPKNRITERIATITPIATRNTPFIISLTIDVYKRQTPDVLTFAGNGEPTAHPRFPEIIEDTLALRDKYFPNAKVSVLSNSTSVSYTHLHKAFPVYSAACNCIHCRHKCCRWEEPE